MDERQDEVSSGEGAGETEAVLDSQRDGTTGETAESADEQETTDEGGISRRGLLVGGGVLALGAGLGAYWLNDGSDGESDSRLPFSVWEQMQQGLRASPDHLPGTADKLVSEGDPRAIYTFVRDEILTQPPGVNQSVGGSDPFLTWVNGGRRGALRSGMGTPREQAEILAWLLERAGYESEVVAYRSSLEEPDLRELYFGAEEREFDPGFDQDQLTEWRRRLGVEGEGGEEARLIDRDGEESTALADRIGSALPEGADTEDVRDWRWAGPSTVPVVRFRSQSEASATTAPTEETETSTETQSETPTGTADGSGDGWRYADLFHSDETFGSLSQPDRTSEVAETDSWTVTVTLEAAFTDTPGEPMELVTGQWDATELAGRQLAIDTLPGLSHFDYPVIRYSDVNQFVPVLGVQDPHADRETLSSLSVQGNPISVTGDSYSVENDGTIRRNGKVVKEGSGGSGLVIQGPDGTSQTVTPVEGDQPISDYYDNGMGEAPVTDLLTEENATVTFLYRNTSTGRVSLVIAHDRPGGEDAGQARMTFEGVRGYEWLVRDGRDDVFETNDGPMGGTETVSWSWNSGNDDGGALGPLSFPVDVEMTHAGTWGDNERTGLDRWVLLDGDNPDQPVELAQLRAGEDVTVRLTSTDIAGGDSGTDGSEATPSTPTTTVPDAAGEVDTLEAAANVGGYPQVRLSVDALNADGEQVQGLPGTAFAVTEDGDPVAPEMEKNEVKPRVIVAVDQSLSVDIAGFFEDDREAFRQRMESDIKEFNPDATVEFEDVGSNAWLHLSEIATTNADLIVYLSDAHGYGTDERTPERVTAIREGPPALMYSVTGESYDSAEEMADLSGGEVIATNDEDEASQRLRDFVEELSPQITAYKFKYESPHDGSSGTERTVTIDLAGSDVSTTATYEVPGASIDAQAEQALCGLSLRVQVGDYESRRVLAGWDPQIDGDREPNDADRNEAYSALFGMHTLSFESAGVTPTVFLEEEIAGKLTLEASLDARDDGDHDRIKETIREGEGTIEMPPEYFHPMLPDRRTEDSITYSIGLRTVMFGTYPEFGTNEIHKSIDILDTSEARTLTSSDDRQREFQLTMERTARWAILERENLDRSTASLLADADLVPSNTVGDAWSQETRTRFETARSRRTIRDEYQLVDAAGDTAAFWHVDPRTGALTGILPDGSGGGDRVEEIKETISKVEKIVSKADPLIKSNRVGVAVEYYLLLTKLFGVAAIALETIDTSGIDEEAREALAQYVCEVMQDMEMNWAGFIFATVIATAGDISGATDGPAAGC